MRYVKKTDVPQFFTDDTQDLHQWSDYYADKKRNLKEYILTNEQNYLCIYCENKINFSTSHLEHIKPKSLDIINLTFNYMNISVSCNGFCNNVENDTTNYHCGHRKDKEDTSFDEEKFLNPVVYENIREYFEYDLDNYKIKSSNKDKNKAKYMINTLHLNDGGLPLARKKALKNLIKYMFNIRDIEERKQKIIEILSRNNIEQVSFLRYKYKNLFLS